MSTTSGGDRPDEERPQPFRVSGRLLSSVVGYVRRALGDEAVERIAAAAGLEPGGLDGSLSRRWFTAGQLSRMVAAAEEVTGDPGIGRRAGEYMFQTSPESHAYLLSTGSVDAALVEAIGFSSRVRSDQPFEITARSDRGLTVVDGSARSARFACGMSAGYWSQIPTLFGAFGAVTEPRCVTRGDDLCEFRISWTSSAPVGSSAIRSGRTRNESLMARFEEMHDLAAELTGQESVQDLLHVVASRAAGLVTAPAAVVTARLDDSSPPRIGWTGVDEERATEVARIIEGGTAPPDVAALLVEVRTNSRRYGQAVVFNQAGTRFLAHDRRLLQAFVDFASVALDRAAALDVARSERDTAESLLGLARSLSELGSSDEIAQRIAEAVPEVVRCERAAVWIWHPEVRTMDLVGAWPDPTDVLGYEPVPIDEADGARQMAEIREPVILPRSEVSGYDADLLDLVGAAYVAAAPIIVRDELLGMVSAVLGRGQEVPGPDLLRRVSGLADHAATALDNSRLLDEVRHRALHDPLTGLANRRLAEDRVRHALTVAERTDTWVTLLFVDLDEFKQVNDELGHAVGDHVLCRVGERLEACVRASDTVARLGGDEFLLILENTAGPEDGAQVAEKVAAALREPVEVAERGARVSASIGITSAPGRTTTYDELLGHADQAMYAVKRRGRDGWLVYGTDDSGG